jgi:hypothetical protein
MQGNYRALVVDNKDPKGNTGRIKVRVYGMHDGVKESALPWAQYADTTMMGSLRVPDKGSNVWVFFEAGEIDQPIYFACAPAKPDVPEEASTDYPKNRVIKTKSGILIEINDEQNIVNVEVGNTKHTINGQDNTVKVIAEKIQLGSDGSVEQSVLGKQLETWINNTLIPWMNSHRHLSAAPSQPTSPPTAPFQAGSAAPNGSVYSKKNTNQ